MDAQTINDLKKFIVFAIAEQISDVRSDLLRLEENFDKKIDKLDKKLSARIDNLSNSVAEAMENFHSAMDEQFKDHEKRITRLEHRAT